MNLWGLFSSWNLWSITLFSVVVSNSCSGSGPLAIALKKNWLRIRFRHFTYVGILGIVVSVYLITLFKGSYDFLGTSQLINSSTTLYYRYSALRYFIMVWWEKTIVSKILSSKLFVLLGKVPIQLLSDSHRNFCKCLSSVYRKLLDYFCRLDSDFFGFVLPMWKTHWTDGSGKNFYRLKVQPIYLLRSKKIMEIKMDCALVYPESVAPQHLFVWQKNDFAPFFRKRRWWG